MNPFQFCHDVFLYYQEEGLIPYSDNKEIKKFERMSVMELPWDGVGMNWLRKHKKMKEVS